MALKIIAIVLLSLVAALVLFLILPWNIRAYKEENGNGKFFIRFLFIKISINKIAEKKLAGKGNNAESGNKRQKNKSGKPKNGKQKKKKSVGKKLSPVELISLTFSVMKEIFRLLGKCRVKRLKIHYTVGGIDPAQTAMVYGSACAAVYPFTAFMREKMNIKKSKEDVKLACDFESQKSNFDFDIEIGLRPFWAVVALVRIIKEYVKKRR